jgi:hypothetical protein
MQYAFDRWKALISTQVTKDGLMSKELSRTGSLSYSLYAINAMIQTAEIARHYGEDLYGYTLADGRGLVLILDKHVPYVLGQLKWPYQQDEKYTGGNDAVFELVYSQYRKKSYLDVINKQGRPTHEGRIMGPTTLTHGNRFDLTDTTPKPDPDTPPSPPLRMRSRDLS